MTSARSEILSQPEADTVTVRRVPTSPAEKDQSVETLRGLIIILVVAGHVIGNDPRTGLRVADDSLLRHVDFSLRFLRMPLFAVISGYVYALRPVVSGSAVRFLTGKVRRLVIPFVVVMTIQFVTRAIVPNINQPVDWHQFSRIFVRPIDQFWFLQALFWVFVLVCGLELAGRLATSGSWMICWTGGIVLSLAGWLYDDAVQRIGFSLYGFIYLFPYFLLGVGVYRFAWFKRRTVLITAALVAGSGIVVQQLTSLDVVVLDVSRYGPLALVTGLALGVLLFGMRRPVRPLAIIGASAYAIFLFHVFGSAGGRMAAEWCGIRFTPLRFVVSLACGVAVSIIIERLAERNRWSRRLLLGLW